MPAIRPVARLCGAILLLLALPVHAVDPARVTALIDAVKRDPAALQKQHDLLSQLTPAELATVIEGSGNTHFTWLYPMTLKAEDYPGLANLPLSELSLMSVRDDRLVPIPFQFDEFDTGGLVWVPGVSKRKADGVPGKYDRSDEMVFMYRDAGLAKATPAQLAQVRGSVAGVLAIDRFDMPTRYVYVMRNQPLRSNADYVQADIARGTARTTMADVAWDPRSMAMLRKLSPRVGPFQGRDIVDTVYAEVSTGLLARNLRVGLNTAENIRVQPVAVNDGPVRAMMLLKVRIIYGGVPVYSTFMNVAIYEQAANLPSRFSLDGLDALKYFIAVVREPRMQFSIDFADIKGANVRFQTTPAASEGGIVDGRMSSAEIAMNKTRLPGDWLWLDSNQGWSFFFSNSLPVEPGGLFDAFLDGMSIDVLYLDDPKALEDGERYPGAGPRMGVNAEGMPYIVLNMLASMRGIDFSKVDNIGQLLESFIELDRKGKLDRLNHNINLVHQRLIKEGKIRTIEDLAKLFMADFNRVGFKGMPRETVNEIFYRAVVEGGDLKDYHLGRVMAAAKRIAEEKGLSLHQLKYAVQDNTMWFPDSVGPAGPAAFHRETRNPPRAVLLAP